ncbi:unnamed protein product, partial [Mesorhabditis belari]|uniref:G protein-coupled receptor n=1 Tax=Mesorhabditis belari TaxID=2138241 RepID=A0AAF3F5U4_9BILA
MNSTHPMLANIFLSLALFDVIVALLAIYIVSFHSPPILRTFRIVQLNITISMTFFEVYGGIFGPIFAYTQTGIYLVGYLRVGVIGTHIFFIFFYVLLSIQGGAIGLAFTMKLYSLASTFHRKLMKGLCFGWLVAYYGMIPICATLLFSAIDQKMIDTSKALLAANPLDVPMEWRDSAIIYDMADSLILSASIIFNLQFSIMAFLICVEVMMITLLLHLPQPSLSARTIRMQKQTFRILALQFLVLIGAYGTFYSLYLLSRWSLLIGWSWAAIIQRILSPYGNLLSTAHSGLTSIVLLTTTNSYRKALIGIFVAKKTPTLRTRANSIFIADMIRRTSSKAVI